MARAARKLNFSGTFAAIITTPRQGTHELDYCAAMDLVDFVTDAGVAGAVLLGVAGEFVHYSFTDRQRLVYLAGKRTRVPLLAGVTHSTVAGTLEIAGEAISAGADALVVLPPYFYRYEQPEIESFLLQVAREAEGTVPVIINNEPQFSSRVAIDTVKRLLRSGAVAGILDGSGDPAYLDELLALRRESSFALLCGSDTLALHALQGGADALVSAAACAIPEVVVALEKSARAGDAARAGEMNRFLQEFLEAGRQFPIPTALRRAVGVRGQTAGIPAVPLADESARALSDYETWFGAWLPAAKAAARG